MASKKKNLTVTIMPDQIMHFGMSMSRDGYKSARVIVKKGEKEYMSIGYEWEGDGIPDFVMSLMGFVKANEEEIETAREDFTEEDVEYAKKKCKKKPSKKTMKKDDEDEE
jgi:hypothetical protein